MYVPWAQSAQIEEPVASACVPGAQYTHTASDDAAVWVEYFPASQPEHATAPTDWISTVESLQAPEHHSNHSVFRPV